jgi:hypothetical protein
MTVIRCIGMAAIGTIILCLMGLCDLVIKQGGNAA